MELRKLIEALKAELTDTESTAPLFRLKSAKITVRVIARDSLSSKGGVEFLVFRGGAEGSMGSEETQEIVLELDPLQTDGIKLGPRDAG